jgi:predicted RNA-binding Zn ribbon-like protein
MTKTTRAKTVTSAVKRPRSRGIDEAIVPGGLIAHPVGRHLALDFCNTVGEHLAGRPDELLRDWESFLRWAAQVGLIEPASYFELLRHPEPLLPIVQLREAIYRVGLVAVGARRISERDLALIREYANGQRPAIAFRNNAVRWQPTQPHASQQLCTVLAGEALSLFCSQRAARVGICGGGLCGWLFLDESRGKRRQWCDMKDCGSRAKARRYYEKHKGS